MVVTVNTDASFCQKTKAAGWAFWIVFNGIRIKKAAAFKTPPRGINAAETYAIGNAVAQLLLLKFPAKDPPRLLIMNTDSKQAMETIKNKSKTPWGSAVAALLKDLRKKYPGLKTEFRHVKAHSGIQDKRSYVNEWCDREAKYHMKMQRIELKESKPHDEKETSPAAGDTSLSGHTPRGGNGEDSTDTTSGAAVIQNGGGKAAGPVGSDQRRFCAQAV